MKNARQPLILTRSVKIVNRPDRRTNGKDAVKRTHKVRQDDAPQSVRMKYSWGTDDEVSKNALGEPKTAPLNFYNEIFV